MHATAMKEIVLFAGPHKTSETSIEEFFYSYANSQLSNGLQGWVWPRMEEAALPEQPEDEEPYQLYSHLVLDFFDDLRSPILDAIEATWNNPNTTKGIILGNEDFDHIGNPYTEFDSLGSMELILQRIHNETEDIVEDRKMSIVLLYQTPRVEQWFSIFEGIYLQDHHEKKDNKNNMGFYRDFLCQDDSELLEAIHNQMNPLLLAKTFLEYGWEVFVVDLGGVEKANLDVEHVIGCQILKGKCQDGKLKGIADTLKKKSAQQDEINLKDIQVLAPAQEAQLDELFRLRDCAFQKYLQFPRDATGGKIQVLYEDSIWSECTPTDIAMANKLIDSDYLVNTIRSQIGCNTSNVSIDDILKGAAPIDDIGEIDTSIKNPQEKENSSSSLNSSASSSTQLGASTNKRTNSPNEKSSWMLPALVMGLLIATMTTAASIFFYRKSERYAEYKYGGMPVVEMGFHGRRPVDELV